MIHDSRHLEEGEIFRHLDGEGSPDDVRRRAAHLRHCHTCSMRLREARQLVDHVSSEVAAIAAPPELLRRSHRPDPAMAAASGDDLPRRRAGAEPEPWDAVTRVQATLGWPEAEAPRSAPGPDRAQPRRARPHALAIAASALLLLLPLAAIKPLRAWVTDRIAGVFSSAAPTEPAAIRLPDMPHSETQLRFAPAGEAVHFQIASHQARGSITLIRSPDPSVGTLEILGGADVAAVVSERGLTIENSPTSVASYRFHVPASTVRIHLRVGSDEITTILTRDLDEPLGFPLGRESDP